MSARKVLLLYVGPGYKGTDVYTANDITKIVNCGATDYLFLNPYEINNAKANDQILRAEWVLSESNIPNSVLIQLRRLSKSNKSDKLWLKELIKLRSLNLQLQEIIQRMWTPPSHWQN